MSLLEEYQERYNVGFPTFEKLFNLKKDELLKILLEICGHNEDCKNLLEANPTILKLIENDVPSKIKLHAWHILEITAIGIHLTPETARTSKEIVLFTKFFTLNI